MSLYASVHAVVRCPDCGCDREHDWQFYFGAVGDLPRYQPGDTICWESIPLQGSPSLTDVIAIGYCVEEPFCEQCGHQQALAEVEIRNGRIASVRFLSFEAHRREVFFTGPDRAAWVIGSNGRAIAETLSE